MAQRPDDRPGDPKMDPKSLCREEIITDRKVGTIRVLTPIRSDGSTDSSRQVTYVGEAQLLTSVGTLPINFEIEAKSLEWGTPHATTSSVSIARTMAITRVRIRPPRLGGQWGSAPRTGLRRRRGPRPRRRRPVPGRAR